MLADVIECLSCPHCTGELALTGRCVRCAAGHTFDVARHGYVSLLPGDAGGNAGDTAAMVAARRQFLAAGHYRRLSDRLCDEAGAAVRPGVPGCVVDAGAGTGYHLARVLDRLPERTGIALDRSKYACRSSARAHPRIGAVACDTWRRLPVADGAAVLLLDVFAPRNAAEFRRILRPDGVLVVVTPTPRHLTELVAGLGLLTVDDDKAGDVAARLGGWFRALDTRVHEETVPLSRDDVVAVATMGPSAWHTDPDVVRTRVARLPATTPVTLSFAVTTLAPLGRPGPDT